MLIYTEKALVVLAIPLIGVTASLKTRTGEWICPSMMELCFLMDTADLWSVMCEQFGLLSNLTSQHLMSN